MSRQALAAHLLRSPRVCRLGARFPVLIIAVEAFAEAAVRVNSGLHCATVHDAVHAAFRIPCVYVGGRDGGRVVYAPVANFARVRTCVRRE